MAYLGSFVRVRTGQHPVQHVRPDVDSDLSDHRCHCCWVRPGPRLIGADPDGADNIAGTQDDEYSWTFNTTTAGNPRLTWKGQAGTFVPNVGPSDIIVYYLDTAGRAILVDNPVWSLIVSDLGTGAFGRWYEYTLVGGDFPDANGNGIPDDLINTANANYPANGSTDGWFVVVTGNAANTLAGHGVIWDTTSN